MGPRLIASRLDYKNQLIKINKVWGEKMSFKILAINPGSTSTKIAIYEDEEEVSRKTIDHPIEEIKKYKKIMDQEQMRYGQIIKFLEENNFKIESLSAVVARGAPLPPVRSGAYRVNDAMVDRLKNRPIVDHASNLGAIIARQIGDSIGVAAYIYDPVSVDELEDIARFSGLAGLERQPLTHALNKRAAAIKVAQDMGKSYEDCRFILVHMGGGTTLSAHKNGKMVDMVSDAEGPFSPERSGGLPTDKLVELCYSNDMARVKAKLRGRGGLVSYLNTNSGLEVEERIRKGDKYAELVYQAMAYQTAKAIGELAVALEGRVDRIILTGGVANSRMITGWIRERVSFIGPVEIVAGENELEALALGVLRVLRGQEEAYEYHLD